MEKDYTIKSGIFKGATSMIAEQYKCKPQTNIETISSQPQVYIGPGNIDHVLTMLFTEAPLRDPQTKYKDVLHEIRNGYLSGTIDSLNVVKKHDYISFDRPEKFDLDVPCRIKFGNYKIQELAEQYKFRR